MDKPEAVFDSRLGGIGGIGSKYRDLKTGRFAPAPIKPREITFRCKFCGEEKLVDEMRMLTRFFPLLVACKACERRVS